MKHNNYESFGFSLEEEIEKVKSLPKEQRLDYLWTYYKGTLLIGVSALVLAWMVISFAVNAFMGTFFPEEPISMALVSIHWDDKGLNDWVEECKAAIGYEEKKEELSILTSTGPSDFNDSFAISCTCWLAAGQPDIFLCNKATLEYLTEQQVLTDLSTLLPELEEGTYWLDMADSAFAEAAGVSGTLYLCMYRNGSGQTRALDIVHYLLAE